MYFLQEKFSMGHTQLLKGLNSHLNVDVDVKSIKYVIKYTMKGSDQAFFAVNIEDKIT